MKFLLVLTLFTASTLSLNLLGTVAAGPLDLEYSHKWSDTNIVGIDIVAADIDGDGITEIISAGISVNSGWEAELRVYSWDGSTFTVEANKVFQIDGEVTVAYGVDVGDLTGDGNLEIMVTGVYSNGGQDCGWLQVYRWDGSVLALLDTKKWTALPSGSKAVKVGDLDGDGSNEAITAGYYDDGVVRSLEVMVWSWSSGLTLEDSEEWAPTDTDNHMPNDLALGLLEDENKIAVGGQLYDNIDLKTKATLTVWSYSSSLTLEDSEIWDSDGSTYCYGIYVDDDKIYTSGTMYDGSEQNSQFCVWSWGSITLEDSEEWNEGDFSYAYGVSVLDLDGDGEKEIVTTGYYYDGTRDYADLKVWNFPTLQITDKDSESWYSVDDTIAWGVYTYDVDNDGVPEILTCGYSNNAESGQITIWSYPDNTDPVISAFSPSSGSETSDTKPTISATLSDDFSGIDVDEVTMTVEGVDVTSEATITVTSISYTPTSDFSEGDVIVTIEVQDKSGNSETATWTFTVKPPAPGIPGFPLEGLIVGMAVAALALYLLRKRTTEGTPIAPLL